MTDEYHCDDCGKKLEDCEFWQEVEKSWEEMRKGNFKTCTLEELLEDLSTDDAI